MAVYHGKLLDGFFIRPFYKMMLGKTIDLKVSSLLFLFSIYFNLIKLVLPQAAQLGINFCKGKTVMLHLLEESV